jgi:hypothetical protein
LDRFDPFKGWKGSKQDRFLELPGIVRGPDNKKVNLGEQPDCLAQYWLYKLFPKSKLTRWYTYRVGAPSRQLALVGADTHGDQQKGECRPK